MISNATSQELLRVLARLAHCAADGGLSRSTGRAYRLAGEVEAPIREHYYDPTYGGMDWGAEIERHRAGPLGADSDEHFFRGLNALFFDLGVSHIGVIPVEHPTGDDYRQKLPWSGTHGLRLR